MNTISCNCPYCNAALSIDSEREFVYCSYCGEKILLDNEAIRFEITNNINYSKTDRKIDEARIKESDSHERIEMERIALKREKSKGRHKALKIILSFIFGLVLLFFSTGIFSVVYNDVKKTGKFTSPNSITMHTSAVELRGKHYDGVVASLEGMGFEDIEVFPMNDLSYDMTEQENTIDSISIGGDFNFWSNDIFKKSDKVVIMYHSLKVIDESD